MIQEGYHLWLQGRDTNVMRLTCLGMLDEMWKSRPITLRFRVEHPGFSLDVALALPGRGVIALFGRSGSGKTTVLRPVRTVRGERQRVAIARALLTSPRLLLMDEPLAALDHQRKQEILPYLGRLHAELSIPVLYVSHAPDEVARLADHLVVLEEGRVLALGADAHPALTLVQLQVGDRTLLARVTGRSAHELALAPGVPVWIQIKAAALLCSGVATFQCIRFVYI